MIGVEKNSKGGGVASSVAFPDVTGNPLDNTGLQPYLSSVTNLENNEFKYLYWQAVSASSGTISIPTGATILLGEIEGLNSLAETISSGKPTGNSPTTSGGSPVIVSTFDTSGNYTLSGTPSAYPVAILFVFKIKGKDISNLTLSQIIADEQVGVMVGAGAGNDGKSGEVPKPLAGDQNKALGGNGVWRTIIDLLQFTSKPTIVDGDEIVSINGVTGACVKTSYANLFINWLLPKLIATAFSTTEKWEMKGVDNNSSAASGYVGEILRASGSGVSIVSNTTTTIGSLSLPPGNYQVEGTVTFIPAGGASMGTQACSVSETAAVVGIVEGCNIRRRSGTAFTLDGDTLPTGTLEVRRATTGNVFLNAYLLFTGGTVGCIWTIKALRVR